MAFWLSLGLALTGPDVYQPEMEILAAGFCFDLGLLFFCWRIATPPVFELH